MFTATVLKTLSMATASTTLMTLGVVNFTAPKAEATPLRLDYTVEAADAGWFEYDFRLSVDNNDGSYKPGQSWGWMVFGDAPSGSSSPLTDWVGDLDNSSPWVSRFDKTTGSHNGITLYGQSSNYPNGSIFAPWIPTGIGDSLFWSGKSTANLQQGELFFSALLGSNPRPNFQVAYRMTSETPTSVDGAYGSESETLTSVDGAYGSESETPTNEVTDGVDSETSRPSQVVDGFTSSDSESVPEPTSWLAIVAASVFGIGSTRKFKNNSSKV